MTFKGKTIWITGASSGIGEALAHAFVQEGAHLILSARNRTKLEQVKNKCLDYRPTARIFVLPLDLEQQNVLSTKVKQVLAHFQQVDMLVNNAGVSFRGLAKDTLLSVDERVMNINYFGTIALTKALLPHFIEQKQGQIVVISSLTGKFGTQLRTAYAASKHALHGFFDSLRTELLPYNVKISLICPGFVQTNILQTALTADGTPFNDQTKEKNKRMPADVFAQKALKAIAQQKAEVYIGGWETVGIYIKRFFPNLFNYLIARSNVQ